MQDAVSRMAPGESPDQPAAGELGSTHRGTRAALGSLGVFSSRSTEIELRGSKEKGQILHRQLAKR